MNTNDTESDGRSDAAVSVLLSALMVLSVVALGTTAFAGSAAAQTQADIVVDADGGGDYTTIQAAVDNASDGDTVYVYNGTYSGGIEIGKNVTLVGEGVGVTTVQTGSDNALTVTGTDTEVTIEEIAFATTSSPVALLRADGVGSVHLSDVTFDGNDGAYGVYVTGTHDLTIENATVENASAAGVQATGIDNLRIADTTVRGTVSGGSSTPGHGIHATVDSTGTFTNLTVVDNAARGIDVAGNAPHETITITDSELSGNTIGVNVFGGESFEISGNDISSNTEAGVKLDSWWQSHNDDGTVPTVEVVDNDFAANPTQVADPSGEIDVSTVFGSNTFDAAAAVDGAGVFSSIQDAVDAASSGDTVEVSPGTYNESVRITTGNITLTSAAGADETTIVGDGESVGSQPHAAIHVDDGSGPVRNVTIEGFTVKNPDGKYGIFAGTGSTNSDNDGIGGLVIRDNVVQNISTNSTGSALTGGPAGIGIRADYGTDGYPGIEITSNEISNVQNSNGPEPVGITLKSFTGDAGFGFDSNGDPKDDPSSPPATDTDIVNNTISNISSDGGYATKGISVSGEFEDVDVINNSLTGIESPGGTAIGITFSENGGSYSGNQYDIDNDGNGERIGPRNFTVRNNEINNVNAPDARSLYVGGYEDLGDSHTVRKNTILNGIIARYSQPQDGFQRADADTLDARFNWYGSENGPESDATIGMMVANPYLTVQPSEAADTPENITEFADTVEMDAGAHAFGVPGPVEGTVGSMFNDFNGTVYAYADGSWTQVTDADRELSALDALLVVPDDGETARATVEIAEGSGTAAPSSKDLDAGWNFVGAPQSGAIEAAYGAASADPARALNLYDTPTVGGTSPAGDWTKYTFGTASDGPDVSSVSAYWVYAEEDGSVAANVPAGVTYEEYTQLTDEYASAS